MTPADHHAAAEDYLREALQMQGTDIAPFFASMAQVHATLATYGTNNPEDGDFE